MFKWCELIFVDIKQRFPLAKFFRQTLILWFTMAQYGTAFLELLVVLFFFSFLFFQDKAQNAVTNRDMITGFSCVCHSQEHMVTHSTVFSPAFQFD